VKSRLVRVTRLLVGQAVLSREDEYVQLALVALAIEPAREPGALASLLVFLSSSIKQG
jgi:hypothetical protein